MPFDVFLVRKLGSPGQEELAMGAIASGGVVVINDEVVDGLRISWDLVDSGTARQRMELTRRELLYRGGRRPIEVQGKIVILVDDGLATGSTMRAAVKALRRRRPSRSSLPSPPRPRPPATNSRSWQMPASAQATPEPFRAVGLWYENFDQVSDQEVCDLLARPAERSDPPEPHSSSARDVEPGPGRDDVTHAPVLPGAGNPIAPFEASLARPGNNSERCRERRTWVPV